MKYTVLGFSQARMVELGMDVVDAGILRWLADFAGTGKMESRIADSVVVYLVRPGYLARQMPVLGLGSRQAVAKRLQALVEKKVLVDWIMGVETRGKPAAKLFYGFGPAYEGLVAEPERQPQLSGATTPVVTGRQPQLSDSSVSNSSSKDSIPGSPAGVARRAGGDPRIKRLIDLFFETFKADRRNAGQAPTVTGRWGADLKRLLVHHDEAFIASVMRVFFAWEKRGRLSWGAFMESFDNLLARAAQENGSGAAKRELSEEDRRYEELVKQLRMARGPGAVA